jgi:hypothetical protein
MQFSKSYELGSPSLYFMIESNKLDYLETVLMYINELDRQIRVVEAGEKGNQMNLALDKLYREGASAMVVINRNLSHFMNPPFNDVSPDNFKGFEATSFFYYAARESIAESISTYSIKKEDCSTVAVQPTNSKSFFGTKLNAATFGGLLALFTLAYFGGENDWLPYGFYVLMRFVVCAILAFWSYAAAQKSLDGWAWALGLTALLYNPFFRVTLDRGTWQLANLATVVMIGVFLFSCAKRPQQ